MRKKRAPRFQMSILNVVLRQFVSDEEGCPYGTIRLDGESSLADLFTPSPIAV